MTTARPRRSDPRFNRGHRSHTSSISGDHRALLPPAGLLAAVWWMDRGRRRRTDNIPSVRPGGGGPSLLPVKHRPSISRKPTQADLWDHNPKSTDSALTG
ncbi:hypothetical protein NQZ68_002172 [Dissostichus eleginoides]|nr:hypothetical protein NQZ68_002172 [Dissostichus eleginoides]